MAKTKNKPAKKPKAKRHTSEPALVPGITCPACEGDATHIGEGVFECAEPGCGWSGAADDAKQPKSTVAEVVDKLTDVGAMIDDAIGNAEPVFGPDKPESTGPFTVEELAAYDADTVRLVSEAEDRAKAAESTYENSKAVASEDKKRYEARVDELRKLIHDRADNRGKRPQKTLLDHVPEWRLRNVTAIALAFDGAKEAVEIALGAGIKTLGDLYEQIGPDHTQATTTLWVAEVVEQLRAAVQKYIDAETAEAPPAAPELWRVYPIERWTRFGLTEKDVEKLHSGEAKGGGGHPIITVGDLNRFVTPNPANPSYARGYGDIKGIGAAGVDRISEAETAFWTWWKGEGEAEFALERAPKAEPAPEAEAAESPESEAA